MTKFNRFLSIFLATSLLISLHAGAEVVGVQVNNDQKTEVENRRKAKRALKRAGLRKKTFTHIVLRSPTGRVLTSKAVAFTTLLEKPAFCDYMASIYKNDIIDKNDIKFLNRIWLKDLLPLWHDFPESHLVKEAIASVDSNSVLGFLPIKDSEYQIFKFDYEKYFLINKYMLGSGAFGSTYKAYLLDKNGRPLVTHPYIAKISQVQDGGLLVGDLILFADLIKEVKHSNQTRTPALGPKSFYDNDLKKNKYIIFQEYLGDQDVGEVNGFIKLRTFLKGASALERARLAREFGFELQNIRKRGLLHGDIKGPNIRVSKRMLKNGLYAYDIRLIDFGLSADISDINGENDSITFTAGSLSFASPEMHLENKAYDTTDLFSAAPIFMAIYGAFNPLEGRGEFSRNNLENLLRGTKSRAEIIKILKNARFSTEGMMTGKKYADGIDRSFVIDFYKLLGEFNHKNRPKLHDLLEFNNLYYQYELRLIRLPVGPEFLTVEKAWKRVACLKLYVQPNTDESYLLDRQILDPYGDFYMDDDLDDYQPVSGHYKKWESNVKDKLRAFMALAWDHASDQKQFGMAIFLRNFPIAQDLVQIKEGAKKLYEEAKDFYSAEENSYLDESLEKLKEKASPFVEKHKESEERGALRAIEANKELSQIINASNTAYINKFDDAYHKLMYYSPSWGFWGASDKKYFMGDFTPLLNDFIDDSDSLVKEFLQAARSFQPSRSQAADIRTKATAIYKRVHELIELLAKS